MNCPRGRDAVVLFPHNLVFVCLCVPMLAVTSRLFSNRSSNLHHNLSTKN